MRAYLEKSNKQPNFDPDQHIGPLTQRELGSILVDWVRENKIVSKEILPLALYQMVEKNLQPSLWLYRA